MVPPPSSCAFARGQPQQAKAPWCFAQFRQEPGVTPQGSSRLHRQPPPGDTNTVRGCTSCLGALPKNKVLQPQELAVALGAAPSTARPPQVGGSFLGAGPQALVPQVQSSQDLSFSVPKGQQQSSGNWDATDAHPQQARADLEHHPWVPSRSQNGKHGLLPLLLRYFFSSFGSRQEPHRAVSGLPPVAGWRKREGRRSDHATSCSRRLWQTFLQHIQPHGTFCVTKVSKNINHQN